MNLLPFLSKALILILFTTHAFAEERWDATVVDLIIKAHDQNETVDGRIDFLTEQFVASANPYVAEPLGEGSDAIYSQKPLYRLDAFDCTTFVETILALATTPLNTDPTVILKNFQNKINAIRYKNGEISFYTRNHFPEADWIPNNIAAGHVEDVSNEIALRFGHSQTLPALINKKAWYGHLTIDRICIQGDDTGQYPNCSASLEVREHRLDLLQTSGATTAHNSFVSLPYLPLWQIFAPGSDTKAQLQAIPNGSILQFVRPRYDLREWIGTLMHVSHQGIIIHKNDQVLLRHASTTTKQVTEEPLEAYLKKYWLSETCNRAWDEEPRNCLQGINILKPKD